MPILFSILLATSAISAVAFITALGLSAVPRWLSRATPFLVALAAGTMLSTAFLDLIPEALEVLPPRTLFSAVLGSFVAFLLLEKILQWHHCHDDECDEHRATGSLNLIGDAVHNALDGMLVAAAFLADPVVGMSTTFALMLHELPQEIGDFGVLLHAGYSRRQALLANFGIALTAVTGGLVGYFFTSYFPVLNTFLLPVAVGSFLYIATVDLIPELHQRKEGWTSLALVGVFLLGLLLLPVSSAALGLEHHHSEAEHHEEAELHSDESALTLPHDDE